MTVYLGDKAVGVNTVVEKEVAKTKFGVSIDNLLAHDGTTIIRPQTPFVFDATGVTKIEGDYSLYYKFAWNKCTSVLCPDLLEISGTNTCESAFLSNPDLTGLSISNLQTISGSDVCRSMFQFDIKITNVDLGALTTISGATPCNYMFGDCSGIIGVNVQSLTTIDGAYSCRYMFQRCTGLITMRFPSLTTITGSGALGTSSSNGMFAGCAGLLEIHFRADTQATIEALAGYTNKFGATNATIYFDL